MSIPAPLRRQLGLSTGSRAVVHVEGDRLIMKPVKDILELEGFFRTDKKISPHKTRAAFEKHLATRTA